MTLQVQFLQNQGQNTASFQMQDKVIYNNESVSTIRIFIMRTSSLYSSPLTTIKKRERLQCVLLCYSDSRENCW